MVCEAGSMTGAADFSLLHRQGVWHTFAHETVALTRRVPDTSVKPALDHDLPQLLEDALT